MSYIAVNILDDRVDGRYTSGPLVIPPNISEKEPFNCALFDLVDQKREKEIDVQLTRAGKYEIIVHMVQSRPLSGRGHFSLLRSNWKKHAAAVSAWNNKSVNGVDEKNGLPIWDEHSQYIYVRQPSLPLNLAVWNNSPTLAAECEIFVEVHFKS